MLGPLVIQSYITIQKLHIINKLTTPYPITFKATKGTDFRCITISQGRNMKKFPHFNGRDTALVIPLYSPCLSLKMTAL